MYRKIIHIDMDAFYASVEQRDFPEYQGKPLVVGGSSDRGVVAAASYEARKYGIYSAMSSKIAARKCPHLIFVKPRFEVYKEVSYQIREIFYEYTDLIEPLSLDEAYLDVTENKKGMKSATIIARELKEKIKTQTKLTASAGISINKFLAKIASDFDKPDGLFLIPPEKAEEFVLKLPIAKFHGIGKVTARKMETLGIFTGADLKKWTQEDLIKNFGKVGNFYYYIARGIDHRAVNPHRIRKSIGAENTFAEDLTSASVMLIELERIASEVLKRMQKSKQYGRTLTLKVKYADFKQVTRSKTIPSIIQDMNTFKRLYTELLYTLELGQIYVRLLGLQISNLEDEDDRPKHGIQLSLDF
ncbi:MAG: DNA polymerase IV [Microscillaceae bacterium]|nr:DNA polymerase IV [Microscillaceae bacterium]